MTESSKVPVIQLLDINKKKVIATTSLTVADFTDKNHLHVLRDIDELIQTGEFSESSFGFSTYQGLRRAEKMCIMDELLTTILLMGFTGKKAVRWKIAYTNEFIRMREALSKPKPVKEETIVPRFHYDALAEQHKELQFLYRRWYKRMYRITPTDAQEAQFVIFINEIMLGVPTKTRQNISDKGGEYYLYKGGFS